LEHRQKEAFAFVESISRLEYLTASREVSLFTDHANQVYIFDPYSQNPGVGRHTANKLMRWALKLSAYRYVIEHLPGKRNVWAEILTRWAIRPRDRVSTVKLARLMLAPITPSEDEDYDWPIRDDIIKSQNGSGRTEIYPSRFCRTDGVIQDGRGVFWIPNSDETLQLLILVAANTGMGGHRVIKPTKNVVLDHFYWRTIMQDITDFCKSCLHCLCTSAGDTVPRPLGHSLHADKPNKILHFDFCYIGKSSDGPVYILILKDDFSSYVQLIPCESANAEATAGALIQWFASFGTVIQWVSDQGSHFKNEVIRILRKQTRGSHHFTLPYCPWTNGTVEVVCLELLRALRALSSEFQIPFKL